MTKSNKALSISLAILSAFFITACKPTGGDTAPVKPKPNYQTFGGQSYPPEEHDGGGGEGGH